MYMCCEESCMYVHVLWKELHVHVCCGESCTYILCLTYNFLSNW